MSGLFCRFFKLDFIIPISFKKRKYFRKYFFNNAIFFAIIAIITLCFAKGSVKTLFAVDKWQTNKARRFFECLRRTENNEVDEQLSTENIGRQNTADGGRRIGTTRRDYFF